MAAEEAAGVGWGGALDIPLAAVIPEAKEVLDHLGVHRQRTPSVPMSALVDQAVAVVPTLLRPRALVRELSASAFVEVFEGEGANSSEAPLQHLYPRAVRLALFAVTVGRRVTERVDEELKQQQLALAYLLDAVASLSVERAVAWLENEAQLAWRERLVVLAYSPGYCGWHLTAQRRLFSVLQPDRIGLQLNDSCLMAPLKSTTGVLVGAPLTVHRFDNDFSFCQTCTTRSCRLRLRQKAQTVSQQARG